MTDLDTLVELADRDRLTEAELQDGLGILSGITPLIPSLTPNRRQYAAGVCIYYCRSVAAWLPAERAAIYVRTADLIRETIVAGWYEN